MNESIFIAWALGAVACGVAGSFREIGGSWGFAAGLLLSPLWGAVVVLASDSKEAAAHRAKLEHLFAAIVVEEEEEE